MNNTSIKQPSAALIAHTPTPWESEPQYGNAAIFIQQSDASSNGGWIVATCWGPDKKANADLIVRAVNSHAALLEDIEALLIALNDTTEALAIAWQTLLPQNPQNDTIDASRALVTKLAHLSNVL